MMKEEKKTETELINNKCESLMIEPSSSALHCSLHFRGPKCFHAGGSLITRFHLKTPTNTRRFLLTRSRTLQTLMTNMLDIWSWICELPDSPESDSPRVLELASSKGGSTRSIQLRAERTTDEAESNNSLVFSLFLQGFESVNGSKAIWVSATCPLYSDKPFLPLVLQLLQETISRSPTAQDSTCPRSKLQNLKPEPVSWVMETHAPESLSSFFNLVFLTRLFWLCSFDVPSEVGSFYFQFLLSPNMEALSSKHAAVLRTFLVSIGVDAELCFMRTLGYMLAKWLILREVAVGLQTLNPLPSSNLVFSYSTEAHGLWILKGYVPVQAMKLTRPSNQLRNFAKDSVLKYVLAHQQLEAVIQLEYAVKYCDNYIQVNARIDNIRLHVAKLGFKKDTEGNDLTNERHFPSHVRVWVGPEVGATYVGGFSLGRSTNNTGKEIETQRIVKGSFGKTKVPKVKATARTSTRTKIRNWRWDQDAEGNAAIFDGVLCDSPTGHEIAMWQPGTGENELQKRYVGANRPFTKTGGLILAGDECGKDVCWRLSKEMEGSVLKWRIGGQVRLTYWPNCEVNASSYFETRVVEWCDEVDLPLIPSK